MDLNIDMKILVQHTAVIPALGRQGWEGPRGSPGSVTEWSELWRSMSDTVFKNKTGQYTQRNKQKIDKTQRYTPIGNVWSPHICVYMKMYTYMQHAHTSAHIHTQTHKYEPLSQGHLCLPWKRVGGGVLALRI